MPKSDEKPGDEASRGVPFSEVLAYFESKGYVLKWPDGIVPGQEKRGSKDFRVFTKPNSDDIPFLVEVRDKMVSEVDFQRIKELLDE